eukprot:TRINITY_DN49564_c0_g1_i1.p1 TRINITY_DN49564_c0_g1~~TRINITY_DN49564_c0_g1_i1.p1  ORF type:complete len:367 (-),score=85.99 TRINITY_DN49564_c0_g1_i1:253-1353(-)
MDPLEGLSVDLPPINALGVSFYIAPTCPELAEKLYTSTVLTMGMSSSQWSIVPLIGCAMLSLSAVLGVKMRYTCSLGYSFAMLACAAAVYLLAARTKPGQHFGILHRAGLGVVSGALLAADRHWRLQASGLCSLAVLFAAMAQCYSMHTAACALLGGLGGVVLVFVAVTWVASLTIIGMPLLQLVLTLAIEFGDAPTVTLMEDLLAKVVEPRFFHNGSFGFFYHLSEAWPRGQLSALLITAELRGKGRWTRLFNNQDFRARFDAPTVRGVDTDKLGVVQAFNCQETASLVVETVGVGSETDTPTTFEVARIPKGNKDQVHVECDGGVFEDWKWEGQDSIRIQIQADSKHRTLRVFTGYTGPTGVHP